VLGAIAQETERVEIGVGVTCPIGRIHPAILAQAVATTSQLCDGRLVWGVGTGEWLNEHVILEAWPPQPERAAMLEEAIKLIRRLWGEKSVTHRGEYFDVTDARILDQPETPIPVIVSAFGPTAAEVAARTGDGLWVSGPDRKTIEKYRSAGGAGPVYGQLTVCWGEDRNTAIDLAYRLWPQTALKGQLSQDLPTIQHFEQAVQLVTRDMIEEEVACGPDIDAIVNRANEFVASGVDHLYFHQIGPDQEGFAEVWKGDICGAI
jgi:G6PDH family F420-dependent oxidoreductase